MDIFKTADNTPSIYTTESRDFQLLEALLDTIFNSSVSNTSKISYLRYPAKLDSALLKLLCGYVGFFTNKYYPEELLRSILVNFPYLIKNKGTVKSIVEAIKALQYAYTYNAHVNVTADTVDKFRYTIEISEGRAINKEYLDEVLSYLKPVGVIFDGPFISARAPLTEITEINSTPKAFSMQNNLSTSSSESSYYVGQLRRSTEEPITPNLDGTDVPESAGEETISRIVSTIGNTPVVRVPNSTPKVITSIKIQPNQTSQGE